MVLVVANADLVTPAAGSVAVLQPALGVAEVPGAAAIYGLRGFGHRRLRLGGVEAGNASRGSAGCEDASG